MKKTITFVSILGLSLIAIAGSDNGFTSVEKNSICLTDKKENTKCKKLESKELVINKSYNQQSNNSPYYVYKSRENETVLYSDTQPIDKSVKYKKINLNTEEMRGKVNYYHSDPSPVKKAQKINKDVAYSQQKQDEINYLRNSLTSAKSELFSLKPVRDEDWTYVARTRVLSDYYLEKQLVLKKEIIKLEMQLEQKS